MVFSILGEIIGLVQGAEGGGEARNRNVTTNDKYK